MEPIAIIVFDLILSVLIGLLGKGRRIGFWWSFIACLFLSPLIGFIITLCSKRNRVEFIEKN
jgi:hypothetical protein